jgi:hypothetical protein
VQSHAVFREDLRRLQRIRRERERVEQAAVAKRN